MTTTMEPSTELAAHRGQLARADDQLPAESPSIEQILYHAIDNKVDVASLERLVAMKERIDAKNAEKAFNAALLSFRRDCPRIQKTRAAVDDRNGGSKLLYRYADLEAVTRTVDPILDRNNLGYTWDAEFLENTVATICTLSHIDGHKKTSRFACQASGTSIMSSPQKAASASTFGQRYTLLAVLGLTTDRDDDGANAAPKPAPTSSKETPRVSTREHGQQARATGVTSKHLVALKSAWETKTTVKASNAEFVDWAKWVLQSDRDLLNCSNWTLDDLKACEAEIVDAKEIEALYKRWHVGVDPTPPIANFFAWCAQAVNPDKDFSLVAYWTRADVQAAGEAM